MRRIMHKEKTPELLLSMRDAIAPLPLKDVAVARAYIAGFLCHYMLDSTAHPCLLLANMLISQGVEGLDESAKIKYTQKSRRTLMRQFFTLILVKR